jgi:hypothetical protein
MVSAYDVIAAVDVVNAAGDVGGFGAGQERRIGADIIDGCEVMGWRARGGGREKLVEMANA